jgi:hypothetical protein
VASGTNVVQPVSSGTSPGRTILLWVLVVLSCVLVVLSTIAVGVQQLLLNTDRWTAMVGPLATNPTVQSSVADTTSMLALNALDVRGRVASLPGPVQSVAGPIEAAIAGFVDNQALRLMQSPQFPALWTDLNRTVHPALVQLLRGQTPPGGVVSVDDGAVQINTAVLVSALLERVAQVAPDVLSGQLPAALANSATPPSQLQQRIADAVGRQLPADFGRVTVIQASGLATAQRAVQVLDTTTWALLVAALVSIVITLLVSTDRGLTVLRLGAGVALGMVLGGIALFALQDSLMAAMAGQPFSAVLQAIVGAAVEGLVTFMIVVFFVAAGVAAVAWVARARRTASAVGS